MKILRLFRGPGQAAVFFVSSREDIRDAVRCCVQRAMQPTLAEWAAIPLPGSLFSLYYLLRPIRLVRKHSWDMMNVSMRKMLQAISHNEKSF